MASECSYLYRGLFGRAPSAHVVERYVAAHAILDLEPRVGEPEIDTSALVRAGLDAEAIEFRLRRRDPQNALTRKLRTLLYIAEIEPENYRFFVRDSGRLWSSIPDFLWAPVRSLWKLWRGGRQLRRLHHVR